MSFHKCVLSIYVFADIRAALKVKLTQKQPARIRNMDVWPFRQRLVLEYALYLHIGRVMSGEDRVSAGRLCREFAIICNVAMVGMLRNDPGR